MRDLFVSVIEQATGRSVLAFGSDTDYSADVALEIFLLGGELTSMSSFELQAEDISEQGDSEQAERE
jgi:hypothetical protein